MGFLAPAALAGGAVVLLAILATYLLRPRRPSRRLSSTFLWVAALNDLHAQRPWRRVPPSLLLILQLLAASALVLALARPFVLSADSSGPFTVVLLDASASMQATDVAPSRFEAARARVRQLIDDLTPGQQVALVLLDDQPRVAAPASGDRGALQRVLANLEPSTQAANLPAGLSAASTLAEGQTAAQIVVIGDGSLSPASVPPAYPWPVRFIGVGSPDAANLAVSGLGTRDSGGRLSALGRVTSYGPQPASTTVVLRVDGARFDTRSVSVPAGGATDVEWSDLPRTARTLEARLEASPRDALALDDAAFAVVGGDRPTRVLLVSEGNIFLEHALALRPDTQVTRVNPADYSAQADGMDLLVFDGAAPPPTLPAGRAVLLVHPPVGNGLISSGPDVGISEVSAARPDDTRIADVPLGGVHIARARRLDTPGWADELLRAPETPLVLIGQQSGHRLGVIGFDVHQSDLPLQPGFPILIQHLLDWLVPPSSAATPVIQVGDALVLAPLPETVAVDVVAPDGRRVSVAPPLPAAPFTSTALPGLYQVVERDAAGRETTSAAAVNFISPTESQLAPGLDAGATTGPDREPLRAPRELGLLFLWVGLAALCAELALAGWQFLASTGRARLALAMRGVTLGLVVLALLGVSWPQAVDRQAVVFVADRSASVADARGQVAAYLNDAIESRRPDDAYAIVDVGREARVAQSLTRGAPPSLAAASPPEASAGTDLASGLQLAADLVPSGYRPRVVLLSDGQETTGDAVARARQLQRRGVRVDVVPISGRSGNEVLVDSVTAPAVVHEGERFSIGVRLTANISAETTVHLTVNGMPVADQPVSLSNGSTDLSFATDAPAAGLLDVRVTLDSDRDTRPENNSARAVVDVQGPPQVLLIEQRPAEGQAIAAALTSTGMRLDSRPVAELPDQVDALAGYAAIILADVSADDLSSAQQTSLRSYVRDLGRGLVALGGDTSFGQGAYLGTPLDDTLPVRSSVRSHRDQGRVALLLVVDQSGSMGDDIYQEGTTKLEMARQAAVLSAQQLGPRDQVGILTFESFRHWILPMTSVLGLGSTAVADRLAPLEPSGGTDIYPALAQAFDGIKDADARYRHLILLTDGQSCCGGDYQGLLDRLRAADITLSTIAIGGDADQPLLMQLARQGDGRYYFADHARDIPRLMTRETDLATRGPLVEGTVTPRLVGRDATLAGLAATGLPQLSGYLVTTPKDLADVLLVSDAADPLLARWQFGLGRTVAWTSDLRGRWSADWLAWPGLAQVFAEQVGWTIAPTQGPLRVTTRSDGTTGFVVVELTDPTTDTAGTTVAARVAQPNGEPLTLTLAPTAPGRYEGSFPLAPDGTYLVRAVAQHGDTVIGAGEGGLPVAYPAEYRRVSSDPRRLAQIASAGGGHVLSTPGAAFADDLPPITEPLPLARWLVILAAILLPLEIAVRRLRIGPGDVLAWLRHPRTLEVAWPGRRGQTWLQPAAWLPGAWAPRQVPPPVTAPPRPDLVAQGQVSPALARDAQPEDPEAEALAATLKWLAARRKSSPDKGD